MTLNTKTHAVVQGSGSNLFIALVLRVGMASPAVGDGAKEKAMAWAIEHRHEAFERLMPHE